MGASLMLKPQTKMRSPNGGPHFPNGERYATVCLSINPNELPAHFLQKLLSISASKIGSGDVKLASHIIIVLNVSFNQRAGRLTPDVLLLKNPDVLAKPQCWGGESKR